MDWPLFFTLAIAGFTACAEFGSYAFVHPVLRRLPIKEHILVEQGLLKTFGRVMPVLMTLTTVLTIAWASGSGGDRGTATLAWAAALCASAALVSTIAINVPINLATGRWDADHPPADWKQLRDRWEWAQGLRSWLYLAAFVLLAAAVSATGTG